MTAVPSDEEEILHNIDDSIDEHTSLTNENVKRVKGSNWRTLCCKAFIILVAVIVFLAILVRSWSDYGTYITKHVFPPAVHSMSIQCQDSSKDFFNGPSCSWNATTTGVDLMCELDKPSRWFVDITERAYSTVMWEEKLIVQYNRNISCTELIIWSI